MNAKPRSIVELPNNGVPVLLMRRTTNDTVKTSVGYRYADMTIQGWNGTRPPTHWCELPNFGGGGDLPPLNYGECSICRSEQIGMRHQHPCE